MRMTDVKDDWVYINSSTIDMDDMKEEYKNLLDKDQYSYNMSFVYTFFVNGEIRVVCESLDKTINNSDVRFTDGLYYFGYDNLWNSVLVELMHNLIVCELCDVHTDEFYDAHNIVVTLYALWHSFSRSDEPERFGKISIEKSHHIDTLYRLIDHPEQGQMSKIIDEYMKSGPLDEKRRQQMKDERYQWRYNQVYKWIRGNE